MRQCDELHVMTLRCNHLESVMRAKLCLQWGGKGITHHSVQSEVQAPYVVSSWRASGSGSDDGTPSLMSTVRQLHPQQPKSYFVYEYLKANPC